MSPAPGSAVALAPPRRPAAEATASRRLLIVDALRGLALSLMALEHAAFYARVSTLAEHYEGRVLAMWSWPFWVTGLITNMAAPTFWIVAGASVALYESARRRRGEAERLITRFFIVRAAVLIALDAGVVGFLWGFSTGKTYAYEFDVLTAMGLSLLALSVLRRLPEVWLVAASAGLLAGYQLLLTAARPYLPAAGDGRFWLSMWIEYTTSTTPVVRFPVLGWCGLMGLGLLLGRRISSPAAERPRTWWLASAALLGAWLALRAAGGYGNFVPYPSGAPWQHFLVMSKGPPSLDFFTFNLALAAAALGLLSLRPDLLERAPLKWLVACGQASLCFYVAHHAVFPLVVTIGAPILSLGGFARYGLVYFLGMLILVPVTRGYRSLRRRHPHGPLKYL